MITIIDYGMGNLRSVQKAFVSIRKSVKISSDANEIYSSEKIVLPGVGHFFNGIEKIKNNGLLDALNEAVLVKKTPVLGICLGMQLMTAFSEEGCIEGFGWIEANTVKFNFESSTNKVPHMGWNNLIKKNDNPLLNGLKENDYFYFVHSYKVECGKVEDILALTSYGNSFVSVFNKENIYGCQFHPEKSHDAGLRLLKNFSEL